MEAGLIKEVFLNYMLDSQIKIALPLLIKPL